MTSLDRLRSLPADSRCLLRRALGWSALAAVLDGLCGLALVPLVLAWAHAAPSLGGTLALLLGLTLLQAAVLYGALRAGYRAGGGLAADAVRGLVRHLPRLAPPRVRAVAAPEGLLRGPVLQSMGLPAHLLGPLVAALVTPLTVLAGLAWIDPWIAAGLLLMALPMALALRAGARHTRASEAARNAAEHRVAEQVRAFAEHQALLRAAGQASGAHDRLDQALHDLHRQTRHLLRRSLPAGLALSASVQGAFALVLLAGLWAVQHQTLDGPRLVAVLILLARFLEPLSQLTHLDQALRSAWRALDTWLAVLQLPPLTSPAQGEQPVDAGLTATRLGYAGEGADDLLAEVDLRVPAGSLVAIVGPSGAGKSTLLALLGRSFDPDRGVVSLGGVDLRQLSETTLAASRNLVFQDNHLFHGSVAWNLRMARPEAGEEVLRAAAEQAGLAPDLAGWPEGWDTEVGPGGQRLSGGQRQRVCLARAFLSPAPLLLLDEPTASLDAVAEARVLDSLAALRGRRTVIVVTHRPALARLADQVVVLEGGRVRAVGADSLLRQRDAWYSAFVAADAEAAPMFPHRSAIDRERSGIESEADPLRSQ